MIDFFLFGENDEKVRKGLQTECQVCAKQETLQDSRNSRLYLALKGMVINSKWLELEERGSTINSK